MSIEGMVSLWGVLILHMVPVLGGTAEGCECPGATVLAQFPSAVPTDSCCLNYSGSTFGRVLWSAFPGESGLQILDLSHCNITRIEGPSADAPALLREVHLGHNRLASLPGDFLANASALRVLDLGTNLLERLPDDFLLSSGDLRELDLGGNLLSSLPRSVLLRQGLLRLQLDPNPWDCSCALVEELQGGSRRGNASGPEGVVVADNMTCATPRSVAGQSARAVRADDVCRLAGLTALFILLPLLLLFGLALCWRCGRKRKRKEAPPSLAGERRKASGGRSDCNGRRHHAKRPAAEEEEEEEERAAAPPRESCRDAMLKNQLMLRPNSALLGSTRDIYEEVEIKLGSVDSLAQPPSSATSTEEGGGASGARRPAGLGGSKQDLETVSVTEVMKDSADREKAYLAQSTEYYSLVPGIEMDDSDHGEYESVDLS